MIDLMDKIAIVTGGASGIGRGICLVLAEQGATVVVADVNGKGAETVAAELADAGRRAMAIVLDVTDQASVNGMVSQVLEKFGQIDILVNDAGLVGAPNWWDRETPSDEDWDQAMAVNLRGMVRVSEAVATHMKERHYGKIVNIASIAARQGLIDIPQYSSSKAAAASWTPVPRRSARSLRHQRQRHLPRYALDPFVRPAGPEKDRLWFQPRFGRPYRTGVLRQGW